MNSILIVDDDPHILRTLEIMLKTDGYFVEKASSAEEALSILEKVEIDVSFIDIQLPGMSGVDLLCHIRKTYPFSESIIITAYGSIESAVDAMKNGAFDYLTKPFNPDQVRHRLKQLDKVHMLKTEVAGLQKQLGQIPFKNDFISENPEILKILKTSMGVAKSEAKILITGETGTGKTLLAKLIHNNSNRKDLPFITLDCTCFQESLLESELFGHKKGAFTGAVSDKKGKAELANGGTLFLDEISEIPLHLQGKLLRLISDQKYEQIGDPVTKTLNVRIIAATNRDIHELVKEKQFREDLFFRLSVVELFLPSLRNRPEDILRLSRDFLNSYCITHNKKISGWNQQVERIFLTYSWPGNVRELINVIERAVLFTDSTILHIKDLPKRLTENIDSEESYMTLSQIEEKHIRKILSLNLSIEETSQILAIDPSTLWRKRKHYGI